MMAKQAAHATVTYFTDTLKGVSRPACVAIAPCGTFMLVSCQRLNSIARFNLISDTVSTITDDGFHGPEGIDIAPDGAFALVANEKNQNIARISLPDDDENLHAVTYIINWCTVVLNPFLYFFRSERYKVFLRLQMRKMT